MKQGKDKGTLISILYLLYGLPFCDGSLIQVLKLCITPSVLRGSKPKVACILLLLIRMPL